MYEKTADKAIDKDIAAGYAVTDFNTKDARNNYVPIYGTHTLAVNKH